MLVLQLRARCYIFIYIKHGPKVYAIYQFYIRTRKDAYVYKRTPHTLHKHGLSLINWQPQMKGDSSSLIYWGFSQPLSASLIHLINSHREHLEHSTSSDMRQSFSCGSLVKRMEHGHGTQNGYSLWKKVPGSLLPTPPCRCRRCPGSGSISYWQQTDLQPW